MNAADEELVGRLTRKVADFALVPNFKQERPMRLVNPDGPEAATRIEQLHKEAERRDAAMIERAARWGYDQFRGVVSSRTWEQISDEAREHWRASARAALTGEQP